MEDQHGYMREPDPEDGWLSRQRALVLVLVAATAIAVYLCYRLALPFLPALAWALALAVIAHPLHSWLVRRLGHANLAAGLAVTLVAVAIVAPALFLTQQLIREAARGVEWFQSEAAMGRWQAMLEGNPRLAPVLSWIAANVDLRGAVKELPAALTSGASSVVTGSAYLIVELLITLFVLFYLFRDWRPALRTIRSLVPLSEPEVDEVFSRVNDTIHATIYGTLVVAAVQGILGGLMFWVLGLPASLLWGTLMTLLAIVPVLGGLRRLGTSGRLPRIRRQLGQSADPHRLGPRGGLAHRQPVISRPGRATAATPYLTGVHRHCGRLGAIRVLRGDPRPRHPRDHRRPRRDLALAHRGRSRGRGWG
jgi:hypothetical protein